jgi:hypothetical protein
LLEARKNIDVNLNSLRTFVGWALFGEKDHVSPGIGIIEFKVRILLNNSGIAPEDIVELVSRHLIISLTLYREGPKTLKSYLLTCINHGLDKIMGSIQRKEVFQSLKQNSPYRKSEEEFESSEKSSFQNEHVATVKKIAEIETTKPFLRSSSNPMVVLKKKLNKPVERTYLDLYDGKF